MGVLMLNDINYSGGGCAEEMTLAQYNALSQEEKNDGKIRFITDVDGQGTWKLLGTTTGTTTVNIPNKCNEILACVKLGSNNIMVNVLIPYINLIDTDLQYRGGYGSTATTLAYVTIMANKTRIYLAGAGMNTSDIVSSCTTYFYYR